MLCVYILRREINMAKKVNEIVDETVKTEEVVEKKAPAKKTAAKKTTTKKAADEDAAVEKKAAKKTTAKKAADVEVFIQFAGNQAVQKDVEDRIKAAFVAEGHKESSIKSIKIYVKPEENAAYYVINEDNVGRVDLFA